MISQTNTAINPKPCVYGCNTRIYWNTSENAYFEVFSGNRHQCPNRQQHNTSDYNKKAASSFSTPPSQQTTEKNNDIVRKKQQEIDAKENEIQETLNTVSCNEVKESKKEANLIGDSDHE